MRSRHQIKVTQLPVQGPSASGTLDNPDVIHGSFPASEHVPEVVLS